MALITLQSDNRSTEITARTDLKVTGKKRFLNPLQKFFSKRIDASKKHELRQPPDDPQRLKKVLYFFGERLPNISSERTLSIQQEFTEDSKVDYTELNNSTLRSKDVPTKQLLELMFSLRGASGHNTCPSEILQEVSFALRAYGKLDEESSNKFTRLAQNFDKSAKWSNLIQQKKLELVINDVWNTLVFSEDNSPKLGRQIFLPFTIGYSGDRAHFLMIHLVVENDNKMTLRIHDTAGMFQRSLRGLGSNPHPIDLQPREKTLFIENIPISEVTIKVLEEILENCDISFSNSGYFKLKENFTKLGEFKDDKCRSDKIQKSGTGNCLWKAPMNIIKHSLDHTDYIKFKNFIREKTLDEYALSGELLSNNVGLMASKHLEKIRKKHIKNLPLMPLHSRSTQLIKLMKPFNYLFSKKEKNKNTFIKQARLFSKLGQEHKKAAFVYLKSNPSEVFNYEGREKIFSLLNEKNLGSIRDEIILSAIEKFSSYPNPDGNNFFYFSEMCEKQIETTNPEIIQAIRNSISSIFARILLKKEDPLSLSSDLLGYKNKLIDLLEQAETALIQNGVP